MERKIGEVTHFFAGPSAAVLRLSAQLKTGDEVHILGATTDLVEKVTSMQIDHNDVEVAWPGDDVAILVKDRVREGDEVFVVEADAAPVASMPAPGSTVVPPMSAPKPVMAMPAPKPAPVALPAAVKPAAKPAPKAAAKPKAKPKAKAKAKPKAKPKAKAKAKAKPKKAAKAKAKPKAKAKAKPKKKKR